VKTAAQVEVFWQQSKNGQRSIHALFRPFLPRKAYEYCAIDQEVLAGAALKRVRAGL
jgi:hypothetical protein